LVPRVHALGLFSEFAIVRPRGIATGTERSMAEEKTGEGRKLRGAGRTFAKEVLVPIALALLVIQFVIQAFKIPSASMEDSLLIGDFLLGLKFVYGSPLPFSHSKLPGLRDPKPGDVIIFRYPGDPEYPEGNPKRYRFLANLFLFGNLYWDRHPEPGQKSLVWYFPKDFIKRCIAQSGQVITVSGTRLLVDGKESALPPKGKFAEDRGSDPQRDTLDFRLPAPGETLDLDTMTLEHAAWVRSLAYQENPDSDVQLQLDVMRDSAVDSGYVMPYLRGNPRDMMHRSVYPLLGLDVAQKAAGNVLYLDAANVPFRKIQDIARYGFIRTNELPAFMTYDPGDSAAARAARSGRRVENNEFFLGAYLNLIDLNIRGQGDSAHPLRIRPSLIIDGKRSAKYTVKQKCYFMMGDNRDRSSDSRYWGLLSKANVKAKAFIIYFSLDNADDRIALNNPLSWLLIPGKMRYTRIGKLID
jgi:signal peptidase I